MMATDVSVVTTGDAPKSLLRLRSPDDPIGACGGCVTEIPHSQEWNYLCEPRLAVAVISDSALQAPPWRQERQTFLSEGEDVVG